LAAPSSLKDSWLGEPILGHDQDDVDLDRRRLQEKWAVIGFGLDLSGYTTNKTSLAAVVANGGVAEAVLLRCSAFSTRRTTDMSVRNAVEAEAFVLKQCLSIGRVAVDIPIDLQNLLVPDQAVAIWELTRRPIDKKLNAMPPLADRIGAPVARFSAILRVGNFRDRLGIDLFETYPAENLRRLEFFGNYKAQGSERASERDIASERLCRHLGFDGNCGSDDDLDAIICGIAAVAPEDALASAEELGLEQSMLPNGFRILKRNPFSNIMLRESDFSTWMSELLP
jgi:hypothetical protein